MKDLFIETNLILNIIKNNSLVRILDIPKEAIFSQYVLDDKILKRVIKNLVPQATILFLLFYIKTNSFSHWIKEHDETLFYLSQYVKSDKQVTVFLEDGSIYTGTLKCGIADGHGIMTSEDNNNLYDGEWKDGAKSGIGKMIIKGKSKYSGPFENDVYHGTGGVYCDNEGNIYEGDFEEGKFNGYGHYKTTLGNLYIGQFKDGLFDGKGQLTDEKGNVFNGEFKKGKKCGMGILVKINGEKLEGEFKDDLFVPQK